MNATRKLYLPGGGSFEIPLPTGMTAVSGAGAAPPSSIPAWVKITGGAVIGGAAAWLIFRSWR